MPIFTSQDLGRLAPPQILERGRDYYRQGLVKRLRQQGDTFEATVRGTASYHVGLRLAASGPPDIWCDCPYDYGDVCKHGIALALAVLDKLGAAEVAPALAAAPTPEGYPPPQLQKALVAALPRISDKERIAYLGHLLYHQPELIREFLDAFEFSIPALLTSSAPRPKPPARTFVDVAELTIRDGHGHNLLNFLRRYDWRSVAEEEAPRFAALLTTAAYQQPEATLDAVMERIEDYLTATTRRSPGFYAYFVSWLTALHEVSALADEVRLFASELWKHYGRRATRRSRRCRF